MASELLDVDGETWEVSDHPGVPGRYHYAWLTGPHRGYGFTSQTSNNAALDTGHHRAAIRDFLRRVDPETGYVE